MTFASLTQKHRIVQRVMRMLMRNILSIKFNYVEFENLYLHNKQYTGIHTYENPLRGSTVCLSKDSGYIFYIKKLLLL